MAQLEVTINGHAYQVACDDGEEEHLLNLADYVDRKIGELVKTLGQVGEARLMLMAGLVIADELAATMDKLEVTQKEAQETVNRSSDSGEALADAASKALSSMAQRIENIADGLEKI